MMTGRQPLQEKDTKMFDGLPFDILALAVLAIFLGFRLRSVLGKRTGFEQDYTRDPETVEKISRTKVKPDVVTALNGDGVEALQMADPTFSTADFVKSASAAYKMILESFAEGDIDALKPLLGYEKYAEFADAIRQRQKAVETLSIEILSLNKAELVAAKLTDGVAAVTVEFHSQQQRLLKDEGGTLVDGDADVDENFIERWTFERDTSSSDPNWLLVENETIEP
jgi:predicted lipid-binding transport protein (Tim44 family)